MNKDNVIEMPNRSRFLKIKNTLRLRFDLEQRRVITSASIISILFLVALANDRLMAPAHGDATSRGVASFGSAGQALRDTQWESNLASQLSLENPAMRQATFASEPNAIDRLAYGPLEGKYSLRVYRGHVQAIDFVNSEQNTDPTLIQDRSQFLGQARALLPVSFERAVKTGERVIAGNRIEEFKLVTGGQTSARVEFQLDTLGRLLSMKVTE